MAFKFAAMLLNTLLKKDPNLSISKQELEKILAALPHTDQDSEIMDILSEFPVGQDDNDILTGSIIILILHRLNISPALKGYYYLYTAILLVLKADICSIKITKHIYPHIAAENKTSVCAVERAIRHAINKSLNSKNSDYFKTLGFNGEKISNGELIFGIASYIRTSQLLKKLPL